MENKINITSGIVERGIDMARSFVDKLITPALEETGLLVKDKVTQWRFNNQIRMLNKAKTYCEKNSIPLKTVSFQSTSSSKKQISKQKSLNCLQR